MYSVISNRFPNCTSHSLLLHFLSKVTWDLFFVWRGADVIYFLYGITDWTGRKETDVCCRLWTGHAIRTCTPEVTQRSPHLSVARCTSSGQQRPLDPHSRDVTTVCQPSVCSSSCFLWLIRDHGCPAVRFTRLTDSSGSGWLPHPNSVTVSWSSLPCWPTWWHLTPLPGYHDPQRAKSLLLFHAD